MAVAGIDLSTRAVDIVLLDDDSGRGQHWRYELEGKLSFDRARHVKRVMPHRSWWEHHGVWLAGIENPRGKFRKADHSLALVEGAILACIPHDITVVEMPPTEWRRVYMGKGNALKEEIAAQAMADLEHDTLLWPIDAYEAYGIARAVRELNEKAIHAA